MKSNDEKKQIDYFLKNSTNFFQKQFVFFFWLSKEDKNFTTGVDCFGEFDFTILLSKLSELFKQVQIDQF